MRPNPKYPRKASLRLLRIQFLVDVLREGTIPEGTYDTKERVRYFLDDAHQLSQGPWAKNSVLHRISKQLDEGILVEDQMDPIVPPVLVLAEAQRFPCFAVPNKDVPFNPALIPMIVQLARSARDPLRCDHLRHATSNRF